MKALAVTSLIVYGDKIVSWLILKELRDRLPCVGGKTSHITFRMQTP